MVHDFNGCILKGLLFDKSTEIIDDFYLIFKEIIDSNETLRIYEPTDNGPVITRILQKEEDLEDYMNDLFKGN